MTLPMVSEEVEEVTELLNVQISSGDKVAGCASARRRVIVACARLEQSAAARNGQVLKSAPALPPPVTPDSSVSR